ncbi:ribonuclease P protein component [Rhizobiales bacterium GAS191]|nr:ribonuclease P protein component [Rhizobiales bacterium GAS191]
MAQRLHGGVLHGGGAYGGEPLGRLTRSAQFQGLRRGKRVEAEFGRIQGIATAPSDEVPCALRFGLIVPKKLGNSPQRNRIKRRLRAGLRQAESSGRLRFESAGKAAGADIGIFPSNAVLVMNFDALVVQLGASVAALMRKLTRLPK